MVYKPCCTLVHLSDFQRRKHEKQLFATTAGIVATGAVIGILAVVLQLNGNPPNMGICVA